MSKKEYHITVCEDIVLEVTDDVIEELMSEDWQSMFYTFIGKNSARKWLARVLLHNNNNPSVIDGLAHLTHDDVSITRS